MNMPSKASDTFTLKTGSYEFEVAHFALKHWGLTREYYIDLMLINPPSIPKLNERATFCVDGIFFHGFLSMVMETYSEQRHVVKLGLISPLQYLLQAVNTRVYYESSLDALLSLFLSGMGLRPKLDYELTLTKQTDAIWIQQQNESAIDFFHRLLFMHGLVYAYRQTATTACCVITDSVVSLCPKGTTPIPLNHTMGMNHLNSIQALHTENQLNRSATITGALDEKGVALASKRVDSSNRGTYGDYFLYGDVSACQALAIQQALDESKALMQVRAGTFRIKPGQAITIQDSVMPMQRYYIQSVSMNGLQTDEAVSAGLHQGRLQTTVTLAREYHGAPPRRCLAPPNLLPYTRFSTALIEQDSEGYAALSKTGCYPVRLSYDAQPDDERHSTPTQSTQASPLVRNALYFSGSHYGYSQPFYNETVVVTAFEDGHAQRPIIIGALPVSTDATLVTKVNQDDNLLCTRSGHRLLLRVTENHSLLELSTVNQYNQFTLNHGVNDVMFHITSKQGGLTLHAMMALNIISHQQHDEQASHDQRFWGDKAVYVTSLQYRIHIRGKETIRLYSDNGMVFNANKQHWQSKNQLRIVSKKKQSLVCGDTLTLACSRGRHDWQTNQGRVYIKATTRLTIKGGKTRLTQTSDCIDLASASSVTLNANVIQGLDNAHAS